MNKPLRVLLLEDNKADGDLITAELEALGRRAEIERVSSRDEFAAALRAFEPQIVICDDSRGRCDSDAAIETVRALRPSAAVIIISPMYDERAAVAFLRAGAEDIVLKANLSRLAESVDAAVTVRRPLAKLSPRQLQVLRLVAEGNTTPQIARRLRLSIKTIETHRGELMKRLGIHDVVSLVRYAVRVGLVAIES